MRSLFVALLVPGFALATNPPQTPAQSQNQSQNQSNAQAQTQNADASASVTNGFAYSVEDRLQIPFTPAPTAPAVYASGPCNTGKSKAVTLPIIGLSRGESTADSECNFRELVRVTAPLSPGLALLMICSRPDVQSLPNYKAHCSPPVPPEVATKADLDRIEQESKARDDAVFRQSVKK